MNKKEQFKQYNNRFMPRADSKNQKLKRYNALIRKLNDMPEEERAAFLKKAKELQENFIEKDALIPPRSDSE